MSVERIVVDASVAVKWRLRDETELAQADAMSDNVVAGRISLVVPTLFDYEITNVLKVAVVRQRISEANALVALADFQSIPLERHKFSLLQDDAFRLALRHQRSIYDAAYLALAKAQNLNFHTGDKRLFNAVASVFPWVKWIGDYPT